MTPNEQHQFNICVLKACVANHHATESLLAAMTEIAQSPMPNEKLSSQIASIQTIVEKSSNVLNECIQQLEKASI